MLKKGFGIGRYAESMHKVMLALGYEEYVTQGGDWGFLITRAMAHLYPQHVRIRRAQALFMKSLAQGPLCQC